MTSGPGAPQASGQAALVVFQALPPCFGQSIGSEAGLGGEQRQPHPVVDEPFDSAFQEFVSQPVVGPPSGRPLGVSGDSGRPADQHAFLHPIRVSDGQAEANPSPHRVADHIDLVVTETIQNGGHRVNGVVEPVVGGLFYSTGPTMTGKVDGDNRVPFR